jgi:hypothetical protein
MPSEKRLLPLAAIVVLLLVANSAYAVVHSFNMGNGPNMTGDVLALNNPNGLLIAGETDTWPNIWVTTPFATNDGVKLEFDLLVWGGTVGDNSIPMRADALRIGTFLGPTATDIPWTLTGLTPNGYYDMIWYNKRGSPTTPGGENRAPNTGVNGFDAGNGVGATAPLDADRDQNFIGVQADGSGTISGTWFLAGGLQDITSVAGVQVVAATALFDTADFDTDGDVDGDDFGLWSAGFGIATGAQKIDGDADEDGDVDGDDFGEWSAQFGNVGPPSSGASVSAVPEPTSLVLLAFGSLAITMRGRR